MTPVGPQARTAGSAGRGRRVAVVLGSALAVALVAGGVTWSRWAEATVARAGVDEPVFTGSTDEVVLGELQGVVTVTGTLRFSGTRAVTAASAGTVTALPVPGSVLGRGDHVSSIDDVPSVLMTGTLPAWRDFAEGMADGPDVRQLEENLRDLGHFTQEPDDRFRWATTAAILRWQEANGVPETGTLPLGSVVFSTGDLRVGEIASAVGTRVAPGVELYIATDTVQVVEADVKLADQQLATVGTAVTVRLPGGSSVGGTITSVRTPTEVDGASGQRQTVIPIVVSLDDPGPATAFQQASVTLTIPSETRDGVLSVPVGALLAITPQQFGVEVVDDDGTTRTLAVEPGLFAGGRVEISGDGLEAGQLVVVPQR